MPLSHESTSSRSAGVFPAWAGGAVAAAAGAGVSFLVPHAPMGNWLWNYLPEVPVQQAAAGLTFVTALGIGWGAALLGVVVRPMRQVAGLLGGAGCLLVSQSLVMGLYGVAWEPLPALLALLGAGSLAAWLRPAVTGPATAFIGRVSPETLARIEETADGGFLHPDLRAATVLTCRLLNENALREVLPARDFLKLCQAFRARAAGVLLDHGACLDPREEAGVCAFFGLPLAGPDIADNAVRAALALDDAMRDFSESHASPAGAPACGVGVATGNLTAGLVGQTYTVRGDAVELSRWLATETVNYEVRLLTDSATHLAADRIEDRPLEFVNPPDGAAVEIFQLLGTTGGLSPEALARRRAFRDAITLLRAGHAGDALDRFSDARLGLTVRDPVLDYFVSLAMDQTQRDAASSAPAPGPAAVVIPEAAGPNPQSGGGLAPSSPTPPAAAGASQTPARRHGEAARKLPTARE